MRQSNSNHTREKTAFLYERLSRDDNLEGESYSISNQKKLLTKAAKERGYTHLVDFVDDGISGVTMNRPGFKEMIEQLKLGKASAVFVKDLSRLGRNYIEVGRLTEEFFPEYDIRLVAVSDGIDTCEGENELAPIRNLFNEWYARDISKKRRISNKIRGSSGEPLGPPPYGYMKDPNDPKHWIIDKEAAIIVRSIFDMHMDWDGNGSNCNRIITKKILTPVAYGLSKGIRKPSNRVTADPYNWQAGTIVKMFATQEYCGDVLNFKTYTKSYKNKKQHKNTPENIAVFKNVHEPIIDRATWEKIQEKRGKQRRRKTSDGEKNLFSGLLVCPDCGLNMHYHFNQQNPGIRYFSCSGYNMGKRKCCTSTHYIRVDFLEQVVLGEIRRLTRFACQYEDAFSQAVGSYSKRVLEQQQKARESELRSLLARDHELDELFEKIYEANVSGKISDERFSKMSRRYEEEQKELIERIHEVRDAIEQANGKVVSTERFVAAVKKYTRVKKLTPRMLNELIERIEVFQAEKIDGVHKQKIIIYYNCIGSVEIPDILPIPAPQVMMQTRKGVLVGYEPCVTSSAT